MQSSQPHHHHHRHRATSPQRRGTNERMSASALDTRPSSSTASHNHGSSSYSSLPQNPRTSTERVIPISEEKYVHGQLVSSRSSFSNGYDSAYSTRPRGPVLDTGARYASQALPVTTHKSTIIHNDGGLQSPASKSSKYEDFYLTPHATARQHKKTYSVDQHTGAVRLDPKDPLRLVDLNRASAAQEPRGDRHSYHLSGIAPKRAEDSGAYEYTTPRGMFETTQPARHRSRTRRGSVDAVSRERPISMYETVSAPRAATDRERGPPVTTRGFDKINNTGITRHNSLQVSNRSPQRHASSFSETDDHTSAQRMPGYRDPYSSVIEDDRRSSRPASRWFEDTGLADRGFGIRATSVDASRRDPSVDRRAFGGDMPPEPYYRDHQSGPSNAPSRHERRDGHRHNDRDTRVNEREYLRERDLPRSRDNREPYDRQRDRDYDDRRYEDTARRDKRDSRDHRDRDGRNYDYDRRERRDTRDGRDDRRDDGYGSSHGLKPLLGAALAGGAGLYAAAKGRRDESRDSRTRDGSKKDEERTKDRRDHPDERPEKVRDRRDRDEERARRSPPQDRDERERQRDTRGSLDDDRPMMIEGPRPEAGIKDIIGDRQQSDREPLRMERRSPPRQDHARAEAERLPPTDRRAPAESDARRSGPERGPIERRNYDDDDRSSAGSDSKRRIEQAEGTPAPSEAVKPRMRRGSTDESPPRQRNYVTKDTGSELGTTARHDTAVSDADADYRRRVEAEAARVRNQAAGRDEAHSSDSEREKHRSERERRPRGGMDGANEIEPSSRPQAPADRAVEGLGLHENRNVEQMQMFDRPLVDEPSDVSDGSSKAEKRVAIVEPAKEEKVPKSILRKPTEKFPEDPNPIREGVAPLKDSKSSKGVPPGARWTKIDRKLVNPESLEEAKERYEERQDYVIVLRVLSKEEVQKFADRTKQIRDDRYEKDRERDHRRRHEFDD